jgi:hypothetical protein
MEVRTVAVPAWRALTLPWVIRLVTAAVVLALETVPPITLTIRTPLLPSHRTARVPAIWMTGRGPTLQIHKAAVALYLTCR